MEKELKEKYESYKLTVKHWEHDFKKINKRIPSKYDIKDAPMNVRQAYKMYYRMKTTFLSQTLTEVLEDDDGEDYLDSLTSSQPGSSLDISAAISDLWDPHKSLSINQEDLRSVNCKNSAEDFSNLKVDLGKQKPEKKSNEKIGSTLKKKITLNIEPSMIKPLRNPKKSLLKFKSFSGNNLNMIDANDSKNMLPDLETILLEKSRTNIVQDTKKTATTVSSMIKTSIDIGWLDRNTSSMDDDNLATAASALSSTSSFGLSNLNVKSFSSSSSLNCPPLNAQVKYHPSEASYHEVVGNSDDELDRPLLHIAKKRRLSTDTPLSAVHEVSQEPTVEDFRKKVPEKPKRLSIKKPRIKTDFNEIEVLQNIDEPIADTEQVTEPSLNDHTEIVDALPSPMQRKSSVIKRSKYGLSKITKTATKLLMRGKKDLKEVEEYEPIEKPEDEINFLIDSDINALTTVPRASQKELQTTKKLFDNYMIQHDTSLVSSQKKVPVIDAKTAASKMALEKKIASGTLNENFVRVNLKKKIFVRGKKAFSFSKYKKGVWKSKKASALSGPEMDMRGCDGGVLKCFNCGGVGHFSQNCKQKGDNLLPVDAEVKDESPFPTLEEAAQMANDQKLVVHSNKPNAIPLTSNEIWKQLNESSDEEVKPIGDNKENKDGNSDLHRVTPEAQKSYIGHTIPEDFLKKSGLLEMTVGNKDEIQPVYKLNADGSIPATPKEVLDALKMFGHRQFRHGQEKAIMRVLCGVSTLVTLSTGSGKSLCYQLPAYIFRKKSHCITLVISPLVSLMEDQVHGIPEFVNAQCLHTNQTPKQRENTMEAIKAGLVEILLVSPEAVVSGEKSTGFGSLLRQLPPIAFACIDEAHCVSQWSHNFRPSYLMICRVLREKLGVKTVLGLTATATLQTRESIVRHLGIPDGLSGIVSDIPLPENLILTISQDEHRDRALIALLRGERFVSLQSIIIYCTRRDECERIAGFLRTCMQETKKENDEVTVSKKRKRTNWNSEAYHAGLPASRRRTIQNAFMGGDLRIVVATIAFGMGINKSDIRGIIHYNMPKSFESYVQEVGRAGRDGKPAHCHVFLDSKGNDLSELRRHIYSNSIDRHVVRKLLKKVFVKCSCDQHLKFINPEVQKEIENVNFNTSDDEMEMEVCVEESKKAPVKQRACLGHEVCFSIDETVQLLDIPEENISTLLCYLELHEERYIKLLGNAFTKCKIISYGGPKHLKQIAKTCPPLAMAIALDLKNGKNENPEIASIEFCVVDVAAAIGWDSGVVKYQLKQLEWTSVNGAKKRSSISVTFSDLGFRIRSPGDLTNEELDTALDSLERRTSSQEKAQLVQLQIIFNTFKSLAFPNFALCSSNNFSFESSDKLKAVIRNYFQSNLPMDVELMDEANETSDNEIASDVRQIIAMYPDNNFSGRALARLFNGISSPCYPAVIWSRCKYWRAHMHVNFSRLVSLGNTEVVKMRRVD